jgi:Fe-S cluster biogenesis protein NfuA
MQAALRRRAPAAVAVVHRRALFIQTQSTPNPDSLKFIPQGQTVLPTASSESVHFATYRDASSKSELAVALFRIEGVAGVFLTRDFISVNKTPDALWHVLKPLVFEALTAFFDSGRPVLSDAGANAANTAIADEDDDVVAMIKELLETRVRPAVQADGGDIVYRGFSDGIVLLQMQGSCSGCPSSAVTLKKGIERMLTHWIPEVLGVMAVDDDDLKKVNLKEFTALETQLQAGSAPQ